MSKGLIKIYGQSFARPKSCDTASYVNGDVGIFINPANTPSYSPLSPPVGIASWC